MSSSLFLHIKASVTYEGRATSTLEDGHYIILIKQDGAIAIHGATSLKPLNFQPPGATWKLNGDKLISTYKKETITINIKEIIHEYEIHNWSDNKIKIRKTEDNLRNHIINNIESLINEQIQKIHKEYKTDYGPIDIFVEGIHKNHVIEVKRGKASLNACTQVERYMQCLKGKETIGWVMSPAISKSALKYLQAHHLHWVQVDHPS